MTTEPRAAEPLTLDELSVGERELAEQALSVLGDQERQVLYLRYGIAGHVPRDQQEVAVKLGYPLEHVIAQEASALRLVLDLLPAPLAAKLGLLEPELLTTFAPTPRHRLSPLAEPAG